MVAWRIAELPLNLKSLYIMKLFTSVLVAAVAMTVGASAQIADEAKVESILMLKKGNPEKVYILSSTDSDLSIVKNLQAAAAVKYSRAGVKSIYMKEPKAFTASMALFEGRKYAEAQKQFSTLKEKFKGVASLSGNHATQAGFYELECMRKQLNITGLTNSVPKFDVSSLTNPTMLQQVEVYKFWELVQKKDWARIDTLALEWEKKNVPGSIRAQIAYCHGLALEGLNRPVDALDAFAKAMTTDFTKSEEISRESVYAALRVYANMTAVKDAMDAWESEDENKSGKGYKMLVEANSLAMLYGKMGLGAGVDLPAKHAAFLDFTPKEKVAK